MSASPIAGDMCVGTHLRGLKCATPVLNGWASLRPPAEQRSCEGQNAPPVVERSRNAWPAYSLVLHPKSFSVLPKAIFMHIAEADQQPPPRLCGLFSRRFVARLARGNANGINKPAANFCV